jgi:RNA-directed DNA polymerase
MAEQGFEMVRYADDFVILCKSQEEADAALTKVRDWVVSMGLTLHPEKTNIVDSRSQSFSFLGYSFRGRFRFPRAKSHRKMVDRIRELTPRKLDGPLEQVIATLSRTLRGWFNYFRHCFWNVFDFYDGMVRKRLRRILLKRHRRNPERLPRTKRWPNNYFSELGLFSLREGHTRFVQSLANY